MRNMKDKSGIFLAILLPLLFIAGMMLWFPFRYVFEFNTDEGINLIKSMMTLKGFELYSEVWSDQPPVLTSMLAFLFRFVGFKVNAGRVVILALSAAILGAATDYLTRRWGFAHAIFGAVALLTLPFYTTLSVSIMIGLPSIAFAMLSFVSLDRWHQNGGAIWLVASGVFLSLSVFTKIWTVILGPIFLVGILLHIWRRRGRASGFVDQIRPLIWWAVGILPVALIVVFFMIGPANILPLINVHLAAGASPEMQAIAETRSISSFLEDSLLVFGLSFIGSLIVVWKKAWHALYLIVWALAGYGLLSWVILPAWFHHQLFITIPAAILAAIAMGSAVVDLGSRLSESRLWRLNSFASVLVLVLSVFMLFDRVPPTVDNFQLDLPNFGSPDLSSDVDFEIVALIGNFSDRTDYLFTDRPMYAFRSGVAMPPELAVITQKRYSTGDPTQEEIYAALMRTKPEQIIIHRFAYPAVREYMENRNFIRVDNSPRTRHYVMREIMDSP
jgi:hypothetical protein